MKKTIFCLVALAFLGGMGCAGIIEFKSPKEFKDGKFKEDPPVGSLPQSLKDSGLC
jgi:hypothetical protein